MEFNLEGTYSTEGPQAISYPRMFWVCLVVGCELDMLLEHLQQICYIGYLFLLKIHQKTAPADLVYE